MSDGPASAITLRALEGEPLRDEALREMVIATARAIAERQGIEVLDLRTEPDRITVSLPVGRIEAMGFAAELRRVTGNWYTRKYNVATLWGASPGDDEDDEGDAWKRGSVMPPIPREIERLLIICPSWVGDTIMATPVLEATRTHLPNAEVKVALRPGMMELLAGCPWVDRCVPLDMRGLFGPWRASAVLKREKPDAVLLLPNSFRSALTARLTGAPVRVGYERDGRRRLLTHALPKKKADEPTPALQYYAELAAFAFGIDPPPGPMRLFVTEAEEQAAATLLEDMEQPLAVLNPGANNPAKRWPPERFAQVADALAASHGLRIAVTGSPNETALAEEVSSLATVPTIDLAARGVTLGALKAVIQRAAILITNDTGPRHIAAALGTPVVSLFGPTDHRWTTLSYPNERILLAEPFLPPELVADRHRALCAIERIAAEDVIAAARQLLDG